jgi:hypothetical protein
MKALNDRCWHFLSVRASHRLRLLLGAFLP